MVALAARPSVSIVGHRSLADPHAAGRTRACRRSDLCRVRAQHPVQADRASLCQRMASPARAVLLLAIDGLQLAAAVAHLSRHAAALVASAEGERGTHPAA